MGGGGSGRGRGGLAGGRGGGRGHFSPADIYCTTTWCFALKGLRTMISAHIRIPPEERKLRVEFLACSTLVENADVVGTDHTN